MKTDKAPLESVKLQNFKIPDNPDDRYIRKMFDHMARRYDIFTKLIGLGQDQRLRQKALADLKKGMRVLDLACGTGDLAILAAERLGTDGDITGLDFSSGMIEYARERCRRIATPAAGRIHWMCAKAEELPLDGPKYDLIVSGYALRNFYENIEAILLRAREGLAEDGRIAFLDLTEPVNPFLRAVYRFYMFVFVGIYGTLLFGKEYPIPYLPKSAARFFKANEFVEQLHKAGFREVTKQSFMLGATTLYRARR